ncbi:hypothetical protein J6590_014249 [Homalodisca vitripennis]|nr:hypothetical protein J6590_014249 [Homalodisca vitripennis]
MGENYGLKSEQALMTAQENISSTALRGHVFHKRSLATLKRHLRDAISIEITSHRFLSGLTWASRLLECWKCDVVKVTDGYTLIPRVPDCTLNLSFPNGPTREGSESWAVIGRQYSEGRSLLVQTASS